MVRPGPGQPSAAAAPTSLGKYELLERIGDGGMAEVFRARLPGAAGFEKIVVIKRILPHLADKPRIVEMFVAEAKLAAQVQHKNVVQVFELSQTEQGEFFMVMELVAGTDLRKALRDATRRGLRLPPWFTVHAAADVLDALHFAHHLRDEQGRHRNIVHRDVTPSNIFLSHLAEVKLGDFGIAHDDLRESQTKFGQLKGKIGYMSPEQIRSTPLDGRSDVFSVGVVLWECLAQRRLFGGRPDFEAMTMICNGQRSPISQHVTDVPAELDELVHQALEPDRDRRFPDARAFQHALLDVMPQLHRGVRPNHLQEVVDGLLGKRPLESVLGPITKRTSEPSGPEVSVANPKFSEGSAGFTSHPSVSSGMGEPRPSLRPLPPPPTISVDLAIETGPVGYEPDPIEPLPSPRPISGSAPGAAFGPSSGSYGAQARRSSGSNPAVPRPVSHPPVATSPPRKLSDGSYSGAGAGEITRMPGPLPAAPSPGRFPPPQPSAGDRFPSLNPPPRPSSSGLNWAPPGFGQRPGPPPVAPGSWGAPMASPSAVGPPLPPVEAEPLRLGTDNLMVLDLDEAVEPPPPPPPPVLEGLDFDALVNEAVEGVRVDTKAHALPQESLLAGLDVRSHSSRISDHARQRWAAYGVMGPAYAGPHPFYLADQDGHRIGPVSYEQAIQLVRAEVKARLGADARISVDGEQWMTLGQFGVLSAHESLLRVDEEEDLPKGTFQGLLEQRSLVSVLGAMTRSNVSGRLVVAERGYRHFEYAEIIIKDSLPIHVYATEDSLQIPELMVNKGVVRKEVMPDLMSEVIRSRRPLIDLVREHLGVDIKPYYPSFMKERCVYLFARTSGRFIFEQGAPTQRREPLARSLLALMPDAVYRGISAETLRGLLHRHTEAHLEPSERYVEAIRAMDLTPAQYEWAIRLTKGRKLSQLLRAFPEDERLILTMAFVLIDTELLRPS